METECKICGRVKWWGEWVPLTGGRWRHAECAIGSEAYRRYYNTLSASERTVIDDIFYPESPINGRNVS